MTSPLVLVHSPAVGPATWLPVAEIARGRGIDAVVPDLRRVSDGPPPYWPAVVDAVAEATARLDPASGPVILVAHSGAGAFLPVVADGSPRPVAAAVLVDAVLPGAGPTPTAPPAFLDHLRSLADDAGRLPQWTAWWPDSEVAALVPDPAVRAAVVADQPRLPLSWFEQQVPVPPSWGAVAQAYLQLSPAYDEEAAAALGRGLPVRRLQARHLHAVVDPEAVLDEVLTLARAVVAP